MPRIQVQILSPGMELKEDVVTSTGQLLLRAGATLAPNHIRLFKQWGIESVRVKGTGESEIRKRPVPVEFLHKAEENIGRRFRLNPPDFPVVNIVRSYCLQRTAERLFRSPSQRS